MRLGGGRVDPGMGEVRGGHISLHWVAEGKNPRIVSLFRYRNTVSPIPAGFQTRSGQIILLFAVKKGQHIVVRYSY